MTSPEPASRVLTPGLVLLVPLLMVLIYGVDRYLAQLERKEVRLEAQRHFSEGMSALREGKARQAIEPLRQAFSLQRGNRTYALALASAQMSDGQAEAAGFILDELLREDPNNAQANLLMARLSAAQNNITLADSFYHRAIYGSWNSDAQQRSLDARLELAGLLAEHGSEEQLLAEILTLQNAAPSSADMTKRIAALYLKAKSGVRAAAAYRALIRNTPDDAEGYAGLAESEMLLGNYKLAQSAFAGALRLRPTERSWEGRAKLAEQLADLDPTIRRLRSAERFKRSTRVLLMAERAVITCFQDVAVPPDLQPLLENARRLRSERPRESTMSEQSESRLEAAEALWSARSGRCGGPQAQDDALLLLMRKISAGS